MYLHLWSLQALIDGPLTGVPRQSFAYRRLVLTPFVLTKLTRAASTPIVKKVFEASDVLAKWEKSAWAQRRAAMEKRRSTSDFERFEIMLLKKQRRRVVQVSPRLCWLGGMAVAECGSLTMPLAAVPLPPTYYRHL